MAPRGPAARFRAEKPRRLEQNEWRHGATRPASGRWRDSGESDGDKMPYHRHSPRWRYRTDHPRARVIHAPRGAHIRVPFGIGMNTDHALEEVGQQTRERIRQIEAKALRKLKHPSRSRKLRSFLDN